ncbi:MAG TPA: PQQ-dependent sugar dehydrogenase [Acidobacteriaceae bacterium]|nr:PQQ-dependent sugar dehydrogenase [Acidobacteriaceae bacterium]
MSRAGWVGVYLAVVLSAAAALPVLGQRTNGAGIAVPGKPPADVPPVAGKTLETRQAIGVGQEPAFAGQTRAVAVVTKTPYAVKVMTTGLNQPWGMAFLPGGKVLVTEKVGTMRVIDMQTGKVEKSVVGMPVVLYGGDAGLLDVVLDPNFAENRLIYFSYVEARSDPYVGSIKGEKTESDKLRDNGVILAKAKLTEDNEHVKNVTTILRVTPSVPQTAHYGCRLLFGKDGYLYVSLGERFFYPTRGDAQSLFSYMGKILRITTDGKAAPGNPFERDQDKEDHPLAEIWSYGHRNPQGLAINPVSGELWESEHGPNAGDEINLIRAGKNYGWPVIAYGTNYDKTKIDGYLDTEDRANTMMVSTPAPNGRTSAPGMEQPRYYWDPTVAPSGMTFYDGKLIPEWKNNLFVATLAGEHVSRLVLDGDKVVGEERLLLGQHQRMRDVQEGPDGALWVITDEADGRLIRIGATGQ